MSNTIKLKRGLKANLPALAVGELCLCTDTKELYIGTDSGNMLLPSLASPAFTGIPAAPTAAAGTNTTQLATTAFVTGKFKIQETDDFITSTLPNGAWGGVY